MRWRAAAGIVLLFAACVGCVGSVSRSDLESEVQARGGGLSADLLVELATAAQERTGTAELRIRSATIGFRSATLLASPTESPEMVDSWVWSGRVLAPSPLPNLEPDELPSYFTLDLLDVDVIEGAIDEALERSQLRSPWATDVTFSPEPGNGFRATISLTNERGDETWEFGPDGSVRLAG